RIEEAHRVVETKAALRRIRPFDSIRIKLSGLQARHVRVPNECGALVYRNARFLAVSVDEAQVHAFGLLRIQREVDARAVPGRPQGIRDSGIRFHRSFLRRAEPLEASRMCTRHSMYAVSAVERDRRRRAGFRGAVAW